MSIRELIDELEHIAAARGDAEPVNAMNEDGTPLSITMVDNDKTGTWLYVVDDWATGSDPASVARQIFNNAIKEL